MINIYDRLYISYQEINLTQGADIYFNGILRSETASRQGVLPSPYQQLFEINTGTQDFTCTFNSAQIQFDWLEISIAYDKSYQHTTIYDSYNLELATKLIKTVKSGNTTITYRSWSYYLELEDEKHILYKMFAAYNCNECSLGY